MNLDLGYGWNTLVDDTDQTSTFIRVETNLEPHRKVNMSLNYSIAWLKETDEPSGRDQRGSFHGLWAPTRTLSMQANLYFTDKTGRRDDSTFLQDYSLNWSPFPDGTMQFSLSYNESRSTEGQIIKLLTPSVKWQVSRNIFVEASYSTGTIESATEIVDTDNYRCNLRVVY